MVTEIKYEAPAAIQTYFTTDLDTLANGGNKLGAKIDNVADGENEFFIALELSLATQGSARSAGAFVGAYILYSTDDTNFTYGGDATDPPASALADIFLFDAVVTARLVTLPKIPIRPFDFKILLMNETGEAFAGSGNTLKYRIYSHESQ